MKNRLAEAAKKLADEYAQYTPRGEKNSQYWSGRAEYYSNVTEQKLLKPGQKPLLKGKVKYDLRQAMLGELFTLGSFLPGREKISTRIRTINGELHLQLRIRYPGFKQQPRR